MKYTHAYRVIKIMSSWDQSDPLWIIPCLSVIHMTDRITEGFVVSLKL